MARKSLFPRHSLEEALLIARTIWENNAGNSMRRLTIFDLLKRSPDSGPSRMLITASSSYGLTQGSYQAELISLAPRGRQIVEQSHPKAFLDSILSIDIFKDFYDKYKNATLPSEVASKDFLKAQGVPENNLQLCLNIILDNGRKFGLIQEINGVERVVSVEHALEFISKPQGHFNAVEPKDKTEVKEEPEGKFATPPNVQKAPFPSLNINIQIHLPSDAKPESYEAIFKNIREYLMGE